MPDTGFADEVGIPSLIGIAILLVAVIFLARRLRTA
jgi:LPXTG-motif cell wall-anchored protein